MTPRNNAGGSVRTAFINADLAGKGRGWLVAEGARIVATGQGTAGYDVLAGARIIDCDGLLLMPGAIDCHVHFRDPGLTHKADMASESAAAVAGGVTSFLDMPNTVPQTTTQALVEEKLAHAAGCSLANYGFFIGATNTNIGEIVGSDFSRIAAIKLFLGSSTGNMLVNDSDALDQLFRESPVLISVHAEDESVIAAARRALRDRYGDTPCPVSMHTVMRPAEACMKATIHALELAERSGAHVHIAHVSTAAEAELIADRRRAGVNVTCEVSPHHLTFCDADYERLGARIKMNPAVKSPEDRLGLRQALERGDIDMVATDHAPHLPAEKQGDLWHAVSGAPMVQFAYTVIMDLYGPEKAAEYYAAAPARVFAIEDRGSLTPGNFADLVLVRPDDLYTVTDADVVSKCGWTPLVGHTLHHRILRTWVNGVENYNAETGFTKDRAALPLTYRR